MSEDCKEKHKLIDIKDVCGTTGLSKSHIYALEAAGQFPRRLKFGKSSRWVESEVQQLIRNRILSRDACERRSRQQA